MKGVVAPGFVISTFILSPSITLPGIDTFTFEVLPPDWIKPLSDSSLVMVPLSFRSAPIFKFNPASLRGASFIFASGLGTGSLLPFDMIAVTLVSRPGSMATPPILIVLFLSSCGVCVRSVSSINEILPSGAFETV